MTAIPYFLLALPIIELAMSNADAGHLMLAIWLLSITWRMGWLDRRTLSPVILTFCPFLPELDATRSIHTE